MKHTMDKHIIVRCIAVVSLLLAFTTVIFFGSITKSDICKLFWTAIIGGVLFSILGWAIGLIYIKINDNNIDEDTKGRTINIAQEAEKPDNLNERGE